MNLLSFKRIYHIKYSPDESIVRRNASLGVICINQLAWLDYSKTFTHIVTPTIIHFVLSITVTYDLIEDSLNVAAMSLIVSSI